ncbi:CLUMA_CG002698, isoform A [Clunio marinus]|uniref:CLUMA_CG002698, isoform A n=1 Tax=Clunio marinus TaxID=568069 RepID=A0A1J1HL89_9DIPT|nr:CLUMA_CG002698, isoform A [Clunio marinus]
MSIREFDETPSANVSKLRKRMKMKLNKILNQQGFLKTLSFQHMSISSTASFSVYSQVLRKPELPFS